jgi:hypothetical protein
VEKLNRGSGAFHLLRADADSQEKNGLTQSARALTAAIFFQVTGAHGSPRHRARQFCGFYRLAERGTGVAMRRARIRIVSQVG